MRRTEQLQGLRLMKFEEIYGRSYRGELSQLEAAEILGVSERIVRFACADRNTRAYMLEMRVCVSQAEAEVSVLFLHPIPLGRIWQGSLPSQNHVIITNKINVPLGSLTGVYDD